MLYTYSMTNSYRVQYTEIKPGGSHARQDEALRGDRGDVVRYLGSRKVLEGSVRVFENVGALSDRAGVDIGGLGWNPEPVEAAPAVVNRPRPATCGKCQASLEHSAAFALVLPSGKLTWDKKINQPLHHCEACGLTLELAGKTLQHLPTDAQLQSWILADAQGIGVN